MKIAGIVQEGLIHDIQNFTATGYRSEMFDFWTKSMPYDSDMGRVEIDEYTLVKFSIDESNNFSI